MKSIVPRLPPGGSEPENEVKLTFLDHLRELRKRLIHAIYGLTAGMLVSMIFAKEIIHALLAPTIRSLPPAQRSFRLESLESLMVTLRVAFVGGLFLAAPWILWQLWLFVAPGLYKREKRIVFPFIFSETALFYLGAAFCNWFIIPSAFPALLSFFADDPLFVVWPSLEKQFDLVLAMMLGFGIVFEVPLIIAVLSMIGVVDWRWLAKYRRHAVVVNVIAAAIITPTGDPFNLALLAVPMILFYEIGIVLARVLGKKKPAAAATPG